ncbi:MAG: hypothetical protein JJU32_18820 [Phormidium sp. BM_Day4_Bin.17]|nr:hypothetical protein [Phormidium sp. BM_Day4_Bin.17]UCJ13775.1 MAG: hypothetical protein JWS08_08575 [Phormidium sp. PBR-2020]
MRRRSPPRINPRAIASFTDTFHEANIEAIIPIQVTLGPPYGKLGAFSTHNKPFYGLKDVHNGQA